MTDTFIPFQNLCRRGCLLALLLLPMACARAPADVELYLLPAPTIPQTAAPSAATLLLADLRLAAFLDGAGLVLQTGDVNLHAARNHRWAEALALQLQRSLRQGLQQQLGILVVEAAPGRTSNDSLQLSIDVDAFHGERNGSARVAGRWLLQRQGKVLASANFDQHVTLATDGYPALVRALGQGWNEVIAEIAAGVAADLGGAE